MTRVGFFGGTGFIGTAFRKFVADQPPSFQLVSLSRTASRLQLPDCIDCDVSSPASFVGLPEFDVIIHGVADSTIGHKVPDYTKIEKALVSTMNIANFAKQSGAKKLIFLSSGAVYGGVPYPHEGLSELSLKMTSPLSYYTLGKLSAERYLQSFCHEHDIRLIILRAFTFGGPDLPLNAHYALGNFVQNALDGADIVIKGDGNVLRSYLHQNDLCRIIGMMIEEERSDIFNVGSDEVISVRDLAMRIISLSGRHVKLRVLNEVPSHNVHYVPNVTKLLEYKNFRACYTLDDIIRSMLVRNKVM